MSRGTPKYHTAARHRLALQVFPRREIPVSLRTPQIWPRWFNAAFASRSSQTAIRVANFDSEVPALNRRELGATPRQPTIFILASSPPALVASFDQAEELPR